MSGAFPAFRPMMTAMAIWLVGGLPATAQEARLRVNIFAGPQNVGLLAAQEKGFFAKRGLSVEIQITPGSRAQRDGLINGSYEIAQSAVDNAVALVEHEKADVIIVAGGSNGMLELVVRPEINSYE
ncbi:MAG TPA: ABC transporter substrate-binding protein, partial [Xanthobacteraceae bacterium]|nr:ABC transporter substrate-binding protein [Xanthobacteraceae bacterium]